MATAAKLPQLMDMRHTNSLSFCVLGSGSGGNSTVLILESAGERRCMLIDAGLSPRATRLRMAAAGLEGDLDCIAGIVLTHLDTDHFHSGWLRVLERRHDLPVFVHQRHRNAAWRSGLTTQHVKLYKDKTTLEFGAELASVLLAHDDLGSVGFVIEHGGWRLGYATDLGRVPTSLLEQFTNLHAVAIESNYDRQLQLASPRPAFLKRRIMSGAGHLSNEQALAAVQLIEQRSRLSHVALLHLSRQCNDPQMLRDLYALRLPHLMPRLTITDQFKPTAVLRVCEGPLAPPPIADSPTIEVMMMPEQQLPLFGALDNMPARSRTRS